MASCLQVELNSPPELVWSLQHPICRGLSKPDILLGLPWPQDNVSYWREEAHAQNTSNAPIRAPIRAGPPSLLNMFRFFLEPVRFSLIRLICLCLWLLPQGSLRLHPQEVIQPPEFLALMGTSTGSTTEPVQSSDCHLSSRGTKEISQ